MGEERDRETHVKLPLLLKEMADIAALPYGLGDRAGL